MKKLFILFLSAIFISSIFSSILQAAEIISVEGKVEVKSAEERAWKRAEAGTKVDIGDTIRTASRSKALITLDRARKNVITLEEKSLLLLYSTNGMDLDQVALAHGLVYAKIEKIKEGLTFEVHTPSSVAGVRGTAGSVDSIAERDEIACYEDQMYAQSFDEQGNLISEVTIEEGFEVTIERFEAPSEKVEISQDKEQQWNEQSKDMDKAIETAPTPEEKAEAEAKAKAQAAVKAKAEAAKAKAEAEAKAKAEADAKTRAEAEAKAAEAEAAAKAAAEAAAKAAAEAAAEAAAAEAAAAEAAAAAAAELEGAADDLVDTIDEIDDVVTDIQDDVDEEDTSDLGTDEDDTGCH